VKREGPSSASTSHWDKQLVLRPSKRIWNTQGWSTGIAAGWLLAGLFYSLRFHGVARLAVACVGVVLAVGVIVLMNASRRRVKLTLSGDRLVFSGLLRDREVMAKGHGGRIVDVEVAWGRSSGRRSRLRLFINQAGKTVVSLNREIWDHEQLEDLRERLGLPTEIVERPQRPAELRNAYPGTIPWWAAHLPVATVFAILVVAALVLTVEGLTS
jgi:hypothetical protein